MLKYKLLEVKESLMVYQYSLEKNERPGRVAIHTETGETVILEPSENDIGNRFAFKFAERLRDFFKEGVYRAEGYVA